MYPNLEKEMNVKRVTKKSISQLLKLRYATILDKFNGKSRFFYDEAKKIKDEYFPENEMEYLFHTDDINNSAEAQLIAERMDNENMKIGG